MLAFDVQLVGYPRTHNDHKVVEMTLSLHTPSHVTDRNVVRATRVPAAAVWDLGTERPEGRVAADIRTLTAVDRTREQARSVTGSGEPKLRSFEQRRENGKVTLLGLAVGFILVVGTVVGIDDGQGAQTPGQYDTITAVTAK